MNTRSVTEKRASNSSNTIRTHDHRLDKQCLSHSSTCIEKENQHFESTGAKKTRTLRHVVRAEFKLMEDARLKAVRHVEAGKNSPGREVSLRPTFAFSVGSCWSSLNSSEMRFFGVGSSRFAQSAGPLLGFRRGRSWYSEAGAYNFPPGVRVPVSEKIGFSALLCERRYSCRALEPVYWSQNFTEKTIHMKFS